MMLLCNGFVTTASVQWLCCSGFVAAMVFAFPRALFLRAKLPSFFMTRYTGKYRPVVKDL